MSIVTISYCVLLLIVSLIGFIRYKRLAFPFKIIAWSVPFVLLFNILSQIFNVRYRNNAPVLQAEGITEYLFYSFTYYRLLESKVIKQFIIALIIITSVFFVVNALIFQPFKTVFPTNLYFLTQTSLAVFSLLLFREMLSYPLKTAITKQGAFWYNTAILFNSTTLFFISGLSNYFGEHQFFDLIIYYFWYLIYYIVHVLIGIALITNKKDNAAY